MSSRGGLKEVKADSGKVQVVDNLALAAPAEPAADILLSEIASQIREGRGQPLSPTLQAVVERVGPLTQAEGAAIALLDEWGVTCRASVGNAPSIGSRLRPDSGLTRECFEGGQVIICEDAESDPRVQTSIAKSLHLRSVVAVPIVAEERVLGLVEVLSSRPGAFGFTDVARLQTISRQLAPLMLASAAPVTRQPSKPPRAWWFYVPAAALALVLLISLFVSQLHRVRRKPATVAVNPRTLDQRQPPQGDRQPERGAADALRSSGHALPAERSPAVDSLPSAKEREKPERVGRAETLPQSNPETKMAAPIVVPSDEARSPAQLPAQSSPALEPPPEPPILKDTTRIAGLNVPVPTSPALIPMRRFVSDFVLDRTVQAHAGWITSVAFSPDGQRLAAGAWEHAVQLWDLPTGQELGALGGKMKEIQAIAFTPDGRGLAMEDSSDTVALWDTTNAREIRRFASNKSLGVLGSNWVYSIAFSPDNRWLASGIDDKTIRLWDVRTGQRVRDLATARRPVLYAAFSPDGRLLASGADERTVVIWDATTGQQLRKLNGHRKAVYAVSFSPDGRRLASASADKTIKLWEVSSGRELATFSGHGNVVTSLAFSTDGRWLASGSWDKTIRIWDVQTGRELQTLNGHTHNIYSVAFDRSGQWLVSGSEDGTIKLWRLGKAAD